jgi:hypothetical protein
MKPTPAWLTLLLISAVVSACASATPTATLSTVSSATSTAAVSGVAAQATTGIALQPGDLAPGFSLTDSEGNVVVLAEVVPDHTSTVLVFYLSDT